MKSSSASAFVLSSLVAAIGMNLPGPACAVDALFGIHDRPGTPTNVSVQIKDPYSLTLFWRNSASDTECVSFEFSTRINGQIVDPGHNPLWQAFPADTPEERMWFTPKHIGCVQGGAYSRTLKVHAETEYCFQIWSRRYPDGVRSDQPSGWACGRTGTYPPGTPQDVRARVPSATSTKPPSISWTSYLGAGWPRITRFTIERQSPAGAPGPWAIDGTLSGPSDMPEPATKREFNFSTRPVDLHSSHSYRVCAENSGGRTCSQPVALETAVEAFGSAGLNGRASVGTAGRGGVSSLTPQAKAKVLAAVTAEQPRPSSASSAVGAGDAPSALKQPTPSSSATPDMLQLQNKVSERQRAVDLATNTMRSTQASQQEVLRNMGGTGGPAQGDGASATAVRSKVSPQLLAAAKSSVGSTLQGGSAQTTPSASPSMTTTSSGSASSPGGGGGGRSAVATPPVNAAPAPAPVALAALLRESDLPRGLARLNDNAIITVGGRQVHAGDVKREVLQLDDHVLLKVGGQRMRASRLKHELTRTARPGNWGEAPGQKGALNPQPLPPRNTSQTMPSAQFKAPGSALQADKVNVAPAIEAQRPQLR